MQTVMDERDVVLGPPKGFRKTIPISVKLEVVLLQGGVCKACGERLARVDETEFDHVPALQLRCWDAEAKDTAPPANAPDYIEAKHADCHLVKTTGRRGESKLNAVDGDAQRIAKLRRLEKKRAEEFRRQLLAPGEEKPSQDRRPTKSRWPKRPFPKRPKDKGRNSAARG
jgi:hypothetical protein